MNRTALHKKEMITWCKLRHRFFQSQPQINADALPLARTEQMISVQEPAKIDIKTTIMLLFSSLNSSSNFKAPASHTIKVRKNWYYFASKNWKERVISRDYLQWFRGLYWMKSITPFYMWIYGHVYDLYRIASEARERKGGGSIIAHISHWKCTRYINPGWFFGIPNLPWVHPDIAVPPLNSSFSRAF